MKNKVKTRNSGNQSKVIVTLIAIILTFFGSSIFCNMIAGFVEAALQLNESGAVVSETLFKFVSYVISAVVICIIIQKDCDVKISRSISLKQFDIALVLVSFITMKASQDLVMQIIALLFSNRVNVEYNNGTYDISALFILDTIIFAPIIEELVFRFGCVETLRKKLKPWVTVVLISFIFAFLHTYNIQGVFSIFIMAVVFTVLYLYTRNLAYPIICHILNNAFSLIDRSLIKLAKTPIVSLKNGFMIFSPAWTAIQIIVLIFGFLYVKFIFIPKYVSSKKSEY